MGGLIWIVIMAGWFTIYLVLTKDKRAEKKRLEQEERAKTKLKLQSDTFIFSMVENLCETVTDLKAASVKLLRTGGSYRLVFEKGNVYYETRWFEKVGDRFEERKQKQCILNRLDLGKNLLSEYENSIFAEMVCEKLSEIPWIEVRNGYLYNGRELVITKEKNSTIPEVF